MRSLLLFAHECSPFHRPESTIGAQRPASFAKHLVEFGWRSIVLACDARRRGTAGREDLPSIVDEAMATYRAADPGAPVILALPSLRPSGPVPGLHGRLAGRGGAAGLLRRTLSAWRLLTGDWSRDWQPCARAVARALAASRPFDACIGEHSPDAGFHLARWFHRTHGVPWIMDFRDPILQWTPPAFRGVHAVLLRRMLRTARFTLAVTPYWAALDEELLGVRAHCIPNGFLREEFPEERVGGSGTGPIRVAFMGNLMSTQDPTVFLEGLAAFAAGRADAAGDVIFVYRGGHADRVEHLARTAGVRPLCDIGGRIPRDAAIRQMLDADLLLLVSTPPRSADPLLRQGLYPGKTMEYFGARRPILCVPGDGGVLDELIGETRTGTVARSAEDVRRLLESAVADRRRGRPVVYEPDAEAVAAYDRRVQAQALAALLDAAVTPTSRRGVPSRRRIVILLGEGESAMRRASRHGTTLARAGHDVLVVRWASPIGVRADLPPAEERLSWETVPPSRGGPFGRSLRGRAGVRAAALVRAGRRFGAEVVICAGQEAAGAAVRLSSLTGAPLVYDACDEGPEPCPLPGGAAGRSRSRALAKATVILADGTPRGDGARAWSDGDGVRIVRSVPRRSTATAPGITPGASRPLRLLYRVERGRPPGRRFDELLEAVAQLEGRVHTRLAVESALLRDTEFADGIVAKLPRTTWSLRPLDGGWDGAAVERARDVGVILDSVDDDGGSGRAVERALDYMHAGLAVVAYRTGGVAALLEGEGAGLVTAENTVAELVRLLRDLARNRSEVDRYRCAGWTAARDRHCWEREEPVLRAALEPVLGA